MAKNFDYQGAKAEGYSDEEITDHLAKKHPKFDYQGAISEGYSPEEINQHLSTYKPKRSAPAKAGRVATQFGLGLAENALLPYELGVAPLASKEAQTVPYRQSVFEDIERLMEKKQMGADASGRWDQQDEELLGNLMDQARNPEKMQEFVKTADIGVRGLTEKATGVDLHPEGVAEKAANWAGFIKNPKNLVAATKDLAKLGFPAKQVLKNIAPGATSLRSLGAASGLQLAEEGEFGPLGTMTAAIIGDLAGGGAAGLAKAAVTPKKSLAKAAANMTSAEKLSIQKDIINDFRDAGLQADIGTITDSDLVKSLQTRLSQSGLTGKALDDFRKTLTNDIKEQYGKLAEELGNARFQTIHEAGEVGKEYMAAARDADKARISSMYDKARKAISPESSVRPIKLASAINRLSRELAPGAVKSTEQKAVLEILEKLKGDVIDATGNVKRASVQDLMNNKIALNDIINYEVQGGQKQLLKGLVKEIDTAIVSHGVENKEFLKNYAKANEDFAKHAKTFRNPNVNRILTSQDPGLVMTKMNSVQGIRDLQNALGITAEGKQAFNDLKRFKLDQMIGNKMTDNVSQQLKMGTFSNLLKNPKDMQIAKELLGDKAFSKLVKLQKATGKLAESAQKFFNASKSGVTIVDTAVVGKVLNDMAHILGGNPWPLLKTTGGIGGARYLSKLMADPEFLKMVEDVILASEKNDIPRMMYIGKRMEAPIKAAMSSINEGSQQ